MDLTRRAIQKRGSLVVYEMLRGTVVAERRDVSNAPFIGGTETPRDVG